MNRNILIAFLVGTTIGLAVLIAAESSAAEVDFNRDVRPLFNQHCVACHGGVKQAGDLSFVYEDSVTALIEPGNSEESYLIERVLLDSNDDEHMPPIEHGRSLNESEIAILKNWIDAGGQWGKHWSFAVPKLQVPPSVQRNDWARQRIDPFILARMQDAGLLPSEDARPQRWLRRVSLDLTGLPPSPDRVESFVRDVRRFGEVAYTRATEQLLSSPAFGQRWASVWLDTIRYADSKGLGADGRRTIWQYRDWVIRAFNQDMPYDQFTIRQLAGDLLPNHTLDDVLATACHRTTQTNEEGGTDDETFRTEAVMDRVNTTWQAWQGVSFGCVQCHSHPYDPIEHKEYYQFLAFFNNTVDTDLGNDLPTLSVPLNPQDYERAFELDQQIDRLWETEWSLVRTMITDESLWKPVTNLVVSTNNDTPVVVKSIDGIQEYQTAGTVQSRTQISVTSQIDDSINRITALRFVGLPKNEPKALVDSEWGFIVSHIKANLVSQDGELTPIHFREVISDEPKPLLDPNESLNAKSNQGFGPYSRIHYPRTGVFLVDPVDVRGGDRLQLDLVFNDVELGAFPLIAHRGRIFLSGASGFSDWLKDPQRQSARSQIAALRKERSGIAAVKTPILVERPRGFARPSRVFDRGNQMIKTEPVVAAIPNFLAVDSNRPDKPLTRLEMAKWITNPDNPLTARVAVNRFWAQIFGVGIVQTQEDFGVAGAPPSHPQLLDDLAVRFRTQMNWSVKTLLRELVLSSTYRQSSQTHMEQQQNDPSNRWLSRGPRSRLPAETIRDQALSVAGLLSERLGGPPVYPPLPGGVWKPFQGNDRWSTVDKTNPDRYRRTIYTYTKRTIPYPVMSSFDAPSREFCSMRRLPSNTPIQALMTLNDATFVEASEALADRMIDCSERLDQQLDYGFRLATCRKPKTAELDAMRDLYNETVKRHGGDQSSRVAAMTTVASVLLNLDEVLTK